MATHCACLFILALLPLASGREFLGANPALKAAAVRAELRGVLSEVFGNGHGVDSARLAKIRATLMPLFRGLPKNGRDRLSAPVMRYAVQRYFSQQHGWIVKGFEPHAVAANVSEVTDASTILQSNLPGYVRSALEEKFSQNGFALEDAVVMVAAVERLTFDEVIRGIERSFFLNGFPATQGLGWESMTDVLTSYLITDMLEGSADNATQHMADKANIHELYPHWDNTFLFLLDVAGNDGFDRRGLANPFVDKKFHFEDAARIAQRVSEEFGPWSDHECREMKSALADMDVHETGRVKLSDFYRKSEDGAWQFREASEYLRHLGALDESSALEGPSVIIPNYIAGMSNCITSAPYYSVCCLNECDKVYHHLEETIPASTASPAEIVRAVQGMPHTSNLEGKNLSHSLLTRLETVAELHSGKVPLHGRLFAQWLHYAFPRECPYPHLAGTVKPQTPARWEQEAGEDATTAGDEEVKQYIESEAARRAPSPDAGSGMWSLQEVLLEASTPSDMAGAGSLKFGLRTCAYLGMVGALAIFVLKELSRALRITHPKAKAVEYNV